MDITKIFKGKRGLIGVVGAIALAGATYWIQDLSTNVKNLAVVSEGMQTCFTRVGQSYTAKLLGQSGAEYLTSSFMENTERCIGDAIAELQDNLVGLFRDSGKQINALASNVHWFHEKISRDESYLSPAELMNNLNERFVRLEGLYNEFAEAVFVKRDSMMESMSYLRLAFYVIAPLVLLIMGWDYLGRRRILNSNFRIEDEAHAQLAKDIPVSANIEELIVDALESNHLQYCARLFSRYHSDVLDGRISAFMSKSYEEKQQVEKVEEQIPDLNEIHINGVFTRVMKILSSKLFTQGVVVNFDVDEDIYVWAKGEALEQVLYQLVTSALTSFDSELRAKKITLGCQKLGGTILLDLCDSGIGFSDQELTGQQEELYLKIAREFMSEFGGEILLENLIDDQQQIVGRKFQLVFKAVIERQAPRLVSLKQGRKKELLEQMN